MNWTEFHQAVQDAEEIMRKADIAARKTARLLVGRLRASQVDEDVLADLKRELADYNIQTGRWKDKP